MDRAMKEVMVRVWSHVLCDKAEPLLNIHYNEQNSRSIPCLMKIFVTMEKLFRGGPCFLHKISWAGLVLRSGVGGDELLREKLRR